jgi:hypothetical protein
VGKRLKGNSDVMPLGLVLQSLVAGCAVWLAVCLGQRMISRRTGGAHRSGEADAVREPAVRPAPTLLPAATDLVASKPAATDLVASELAVSEFAAPEFPMAPKLPAPSEFAASEFAASEFAASEFAASARRPSPTSRDVAREQRVRMRNAGTSTHTPPRLDRDPARTTS